MSTATADWYEHPFFEEPDLESFDDGTTSEGHLWHSASPRWGHSMHTMCSYHGMFPAKLVHFFIQRYSRPNDIVLDPFSGRGTVALQARVESRRTISGDLSPLAYVLSRAKTAPPGWNAVNRYLDALEKGYKPTTQREPDVSADISMLYHPKSLKQLCYLRSALPFDKVASWTPEMCMIAGALAGIMHGSHRRDGTSQYLSISMPNTFSMSPAYVAKFIKEKGLIAPDQNVFERLRDKLARLYLDAIDGPDGRMFAVDASDLMRHKEVRAGSVDLIVTSPPYLQVVNYGTANWIRLWLLGVDEVGRERGEGRIKLDGVLDHRHNYQSYKEFMLRTLQGMQRVLHRNGVAAVVIGDVADPGKDPVPLAQKIWDDIGDITGLRLLRLIKDDLPADKKVSRIWGETKGQATNRDCILVLAHEDGQPRDGSDEIDWYEPYKDGGPDAAHSRVRARPLGAQAQIAETRSGH